MTESERRQHWNGKRKRKSTQEKIVNEKTKAKANAHARTHTPAHTKKDGDVAYVPSSASWRHLVPKLHRSNQVTCSLRRG